MKHEVDLKNKILRTDLAVELIDNGGFKKVDDVKITSICLNEDEASKIGKSMGNYITIEFDDVTDSFNENKVKNILTDELKKILCSKNIKKSDVGLIIGLGNKKSTPDALGPLVVDKVVVTNHIYMYGSLDDKYNRVCAITPGVTGETGIETGDMIKSIVNEVKPNFVIVIDALAASSIERVNKTIQMTDSGINPGSGVGNKRKEISEKTLNIPTIAIGIPTVVDAACIVSDTINYIYSHFAYHKQAYYNPASKLTMGVNYLKLQKNFKINNDDKKKILGMIGMLNDEETKRLIYEILTPIGYNLMVTPKEEDFVLEKLSRIISGSINECMRS